MYEVGSERLPTDPRWSCVYVWLITEIILFYMRPRKFARNIVFLEYNDDGPSLEISWGYFCPLASYPPQLIQKKKYLL